MSTTETVEKLVAPVLSELGIELVDVESERGHLKVTIDREPRLDLGAISEATAAISHVLDEADPVPGGRYELEVTSPGVERRLRRPEHFSRVVGTEIAVKLRAGVAHDGERRFEGRLTAADETGIAMEIPSDQVLTKRVSFEDVESAHTVFDWRAALAEAPSPPTRQARRSARPTAADRSRAAAAARSAQSGGAEWRNTSGANHPPSTRSGQTERMLTDDDRHVTETL
jgi:ribosome maturation factor RimP